MPENNQKIKIDGCDRAAMVALSFIQTLDYER
jgi:hypothetical protein